MKRAGFAVAGFAAMTLLVGCVTVNESYTGVTNEAKRDYLAYAGGKTPVLVRAVNSPFNEGALRTAAVAASHAAEAIPASAVEFTENDKAAAQAQFRVVMVFDPAINVSPHDICKADAAAPAVSRAPGELRIYSVFCSHDEPLAGTLVSGPAPSGLNDQAYIKMVHMAFGNMFPTNDPEGANEPPVIPSS